jgi:hypothetical protein
MGNRNFRSSVSVSVVQPEIRVSRNPSFNSIVKTIEVKPVDKSKCKTCDKKGKEFTVVSRDGNKFINMYYCRTCSNHWSD